MVGWVDVGQHLEHSLDHVNIFKANPNHTVLGQICSFQHYHADPNHTVLGHFQHGSSSYGLMCNQARAVSITWFGSVQLGIVRRVMDSVGDLDTCLSSIESCISHC